MSQFAQLLKKACLSTRQVRCLSGYYFDGMSQDQIAQVLGISRRTVREHIEAGEAKLKAAGLPEPRHVKVARKMTPTDPQRMDNLDPSKIRAIF